MISRFCHTVHRTLLSFICRSFAITSNTWCMEGFICLSFVTYLTASFKCEVSYYCGPAYSSVCLKTSFLTLTSCCIAADCFAFPCPWQLYVKGLFQHQHWLVQALFFHAWWDHSSFLMLFYLPPLGSFPHFRCMTLPLSIFAFLLGFFTESCKCWLWGTSGDHLVSVKG